MQQRRLLVILILLILIIACVLGIFLVSRMLGGGAPKTTPIPTATRSEVAETEEPEATEEMAEPTATPTPTQVVAVTPTVELEETEEMEEATEEATVEPTEEAMPVPTSADTTPVTTARATDLFKNGGFEEGFGKNGVAEGWTSFDNGSFSYAFFDATTVNKVFEGAHAQMMRMEGATQADRYLGIYQTLDTIPGETYMLKLRGMVLTGAGNVEETSYGYRMHLGIDYKGGTDWQAIEDWVELPWDEQMWDTESLEFGEYETTVMAQSGKTTVFVRALKRWADPGRADYVIDEVSFTGSAMAEAAPTSTSMPTAAASDEDATPEPTPTEEPLTPITGGEDMLPLLLNVQLLIAVLFLVVLVGGALWKARHSDG